MSARDAARLLGLSHQRVHQLTQAEAEEHRRHRQPRLRLDCIASEHLHRIKACRFEIREKRAGGRCWRSDGVRKCHNRPRVTRPTLVSRVRNPLCIEGGDAPGWQGAKSENIGNI